MKPENWVAIYAAIVGTGALLLNLKTWFDSRVKLTLRLIPNGQIIGGDRQFDETDLIILTVINRGGAVTMITSMVLFEMTSWAQRWRYRPKKSYMIPNPQLKGYPANVPSALDPSKMWTGVVRKRADVISDLHTGNFYIGVYGSHRNRPHLIHIPKQERNASGA